MWALQGMSMIPTIMDVFHEQQDATNITLPNKSQLAINETVTIKEYISDQVELSLEFIIGIAVMTSILTSLILGIILFLLFRGDRSGQRQAEGSPSTK